MPGNEQTSHEPAVEIAAYVRETAALLGLPLADAHRPGVEANLAQLRSIAGPLLDFPLPETTEPAPVFVP